MRCILVLTVTLLLLAPATFATAASQGSAPASIQNQPTELSAAKMGKAKSKPARKIEYMRAVPSK